MLTLSEQPMILKGFLKGLCLNQTVFIISFSHCLWISDSLQTLLNTDIVHLSLRYPTFVIYNKC